VKEKLFIISGMLYPQGIAFFIHFEDIHFVFALLSVNFSQQ